MTVLGEHLEKTSVPLPDGKSANGRARPNLARFAREPRSDQPLVRNDRRISLFAF